MYRFLWLEESRIQRYKVFHFLILNILVVQIRWMVYPSLSRLQQCYRVWPMCYGTRKHGLMRRGARRRCRSLVVSYVYIPICVWIYMYIYVYLHIYTATHCNTLQHTATHCNTLQWTATHCNTLKHTATHCNTLQHMYIYVYQHIYTYTCMLIILYQMLRGSRW